MDKLSDEYILCIYAEGFKVLGTLSPLWSALLASLMSSVFSNVTTQEQLHEF